MNKRSYSKVEKEGFWSGMKNDLLYGISVLTILASATAIYVIGAIYRTMPGINVALAVLLVSAAGVITAQALKFAITRRGLTPGETFLNVFVAGFLSATASNQALLQVPSSWGQLLSISSFTAAIAFLIYFTANAGYMAAKSRHLKTLSSLMIIGTPYVFGWLLLLGNTPILKELAGTISFYRDPLFLEIAGRFIIVLVFNEIVTAAIRLATGKSILRSPRAHMYLIMISLGVVISPYIADAGSSQAVGNLALPLQLVAAFVMTVFSHAPLWGETYLLTGMLLDGTQGTSPSEETIRGNISRGFRKGMAYSGIFISVVYLIRIVLNLGVSQVLMASIPVLIGTIAGALIFPFIKNVLETFDGSKPFFIRLRYSYRNWVLYARGAVFGFGMSYGINIGIFQQPMSTRIPYGLLVGVASSGLVSFIRDLIYSFRNQGKIQTWKIYFFDTLIGAFVGSAVAFYLDTAQVPVIINKFRQYTSAGFEAREYITYPLLNKWGMIDLGAYTGGVKLLYTEAFAGVLNWSVAAWLFAVNRVFMEAYFKKDKSVIKNFFTKEGAQDLIKHLVRVMRWGLWMAPIIFTFLRMMPQPTWYNQDGLIRTFFATFQSITSSTESFQAWSLNVFLYILIYDFFRILVWMDHMGLRVATLVNWSFLGLDRVDEKIARFIGPIAAQKYIPEAVKRFVTWAPLLIPFYLPRGNDWEYLWVTSQSLRTAPLYIRIQEIVTSLSTNQFLVFAVLGITIVTGGFSTRRALRNKKKKKKKKMYKLRSDDYSVCVREDGSVHSTIKKEVYDNWQSQTNIFEYDISRRSYDIIDPCGRSIFIRETSGNKKQEASFWPVIGNFPADKFERSKITKDKLKNKIKTINKNNGIKTEIEITMENGCSNTERWSVSVENTTGKKRNLEIMPYLEWVLNGPNDDRFHPQYSKLFPEIEYVSEANAILAWQKKSKLMGYMAVDYPASGYLNYRLDFIGRARSIWDPEIMETMDFKEPEDTDGYPTFDPIGSMLLDVELKPGDVKKFDLIVGCSENRESAINNIKGCLDTDSAGKSGKNKKSAESKKKERPFIGHGKIPKGTPVPYHRYLNGGDNMLVKTPYTPRPFDHQLCNSQGHAVMLTNRGLHTTSNFNSQQNRLTPDCSDIVTREIPGEAFYIYDIDTGSWFSPTLHPVNNHDAKNEVEYSVEGTAVYRMAHKDVETELTVFVPPEDSAGIYMLKIKNKGKSPKRFRISPYFQMVLAFMPEQGQPGANSPASLTYKKDKKTQALYFENPANTFRKGHAFVAMTEKPDITVTERGKFFGEERGAGNPYMPETGSPSPSPGTDNRPIAGFLKTVAVPAEGEYTVAVIMGQNSEKEKAEKTVEKYRNIEAVKESLKETRNWWRNVMDTCKIETNSDEFDNLQNWLKYQDIVDRVWARRGFYQSSGAYGYRDQLQDTINIMWVDPSMARKQIILHASQQFLEGDVFHWFFTLPDGSTAFACRSHASDNLLWLVWGTVEYIKATGDHSILEEMTSYVFSEDPFEPLPKNPHGIGGLYGRTTRSDTIYRHCLKSIDLVFDKRTGVNGLPLIGAGDWNDGLDEIGSQGKGESVWLGLFLYYSLKDLLKIIEEKDGKDRKDYYERKLNGLKDAIENTWREDRYLRAFHDDGTEIGIEGSGIWEIDALTAAWAVISGVNPERSEIMFNTALDVLEKGNQILLGWPALNEHTKPYLGRSCVYPEGVRENGMYCHGVQWLIKAARILAEKHEKSGNAKKADEYRATTYRLWRKITPVAHTTEKEIEVYGGQPNKQPADILTNFDPGRMIWNGYTGSGGWLFREAVEGVIGGKLEKNKPVLPNDMDKARGDLKIKKVERNIKNSPLKGVESKEK